MNTLNSKIPQFLELLQLNVNQAIENTVNSIKNDSQAACPVRTGKLKASVNITAISGGKRIEYQVPYAVWVDYKRGFFRNAALRNEQTFVDEMKNAISKSIGGI